MVAIRLLKPSEVSAVRLRCRTEDCGGELSYRLDKPDRGLPRHCPYCNKGYAEFNGVVPGHELVHQLRKMRHQDDLPFTLFLEIDTNEARTP